VLAADAPILDLGVESYVKGFMFAHETATVLASAEESSPMGPINLQAIAPLHPLSDERVLLGRAHMR
jgi:hypothetical protein